MDAQLRQMGMDDQMRLEYLKQLTGMDQAQLQIALAGKAQNQQVMGGLMQAGSVLLTAFAPTALSSQLALSGMGDIVPGWFSVPQNSVTNRGPNMAMMPAPAVAGGGMGAAIPRPFGRR